MTKYILLVEIITAKAYAAETCIEYSWHKLLCNIANHFAANYRKLYNNFNNGPELNSIRAKLQHIDTSSKS